MSEQTSFSYEQVVNDLADQIKTLTVQNAVLRAALLNCQQELALANQAKVDSEH